MWCLTIYVLQISVHTIVDGLMAKYVYIVKRVNNHI